MDIVYHSRLVPEFVVNKDRGRHWRLVAPFEFSVDGKRFAVPVDFWTDFASVPRFLWPVISPYDLGVGPIPHDFGYFTGYANKEWWDAVFLSCMEKDGISGWKRSAAYRAVSWFGGSVWSRYRKENKMHPAVKGIDDSLGILNWGPRHHVPPTAHRGVLDQEQASWLGFVTAQTGA